MQRKIDIKHKNEDKAKSVAIKINEVSVIPWQSKLKQAFAFWKTALILIYLKRQPNSAHNVIKMQYYIMT